MKRFRQIFTVSALVALAFLLTRTAVTQEAPIRRQAVRITSTPAGARVSINDEEKKVTPLEDTLWANTTYRIRIFKRGYVPWDTTLTAPVSFATLSVVLQRQKAPLWLIFEQPDVIGAKIILHFLDQDTTWTGTISRSKAGLSYQANVYMGKYRLKIERSGYETFEQELLVPKEEGLTLTIKLTRRAQPEPVPGPSALESIRVIAEDYRERSEPFMESALGLEGKAVTPESGPHIPLSDERLELLLKDLGVYLDYARRLETEMGSTKDPQVLRSIARLSAYVGIVQGKYRRFPEAHRLFERARELWPTIGREPSPFRGAAEGDTLGALMDYAETWYRRMGRVDVFVSPIWTADDSLRSIPLQLERVLSAGELVDSTVAEKAMNDSLFVRARCVLQDSIQGEVNAFSLYLPRGNYILADKDSLVVSTEFQATDPASIIRVDPRVEVWLPRARTAADTVMLRAVTNGEPGLIVDRKRLTFLQEYELLVHTYDYKRHQQRIVFYPKGFPKPDWKGVTAIQAAPGKECLYFKKLPRKSRMGSGFR